MGVAFNTDSINAPNTFSQPLAIKTGGLLTLTGTFTATISVQRLLEGTTVASPTWVDVTNNSGTAFTATLIGTYTVAPISVPGIYRWGIKTGNYTSGSAVGTLSGQ
jgi:hypothetical protein